MALTFDKNSAPLDVATYKVQTAVTMLAVMSDK